MPLAPSPVLSPAAHVYVPFGGRYRSAMNIHLRTALGGEQAEPALINTVRRELRVVDPRLPVLGVKTLAGFRDSTLVLWSIRTIARMFVTFGALALLLALVGVYGVKSYVVSRRTREIGIRMALGASPAEVQWLVLKEGLVLTGVGLGVGLLAAAGIGRLVASMLYRVSPFDPIVFVLTAVALALAATAACYLPARRATKVAPITALRTE